MSQYSQNYKQNADSLKDCQRLVCSLLMTRLEFNCLQSSQYVYYMHTIFIMNARDCYHNTTSVKLYVSEFFTIGKTTFVHIQKFLTVTQTTNFEIKDSSVLTNLQQMRFNGRLSTVNGYNYFSDFRACPPNCSL